MGRTPVRPRRHPRLGWLVLVPLLIATFLARDAWAAKKERFRDRCNKTVEVNDDVRSPPLTPANRGKPLYCFYKFRVNPQRSDWIITLRFYRLKVGFLNETSCGEGFVQIIDGNDATPVSNRKSPGFFCGEIHRDQTYISETSFVKVNFYAQSYSEDTYVGFDSRAEQQFELYARYGPNPILYPDRRGKLVAGTFCDRIFHDCRLGTCYVQSPGFPGVYPRNLHCRYFLHTGGPYISPYLENEVLSVGGQRCADLIVCPVHAVSTNCDGDYLRLHDGWSETSPVIGTFCGTGRFPFAVTGTGTRLLAVFVTSPVGPLLSTGFNFNVGPNPKWLGPGAAKINGTCGRIFRSEEGLSAEERRFYSLATWYEPHTRCDFLLVGRSHEIVRLYFKSFRVRRPQHAISPPARDCAESLAVYDGAQADEARILALLCDTWAAPVQETRDFVSSGSAMLVQFSSAAGSYAGSSLDFWVQFDFFNAYTHGQHVAGTVCDETFEAGISARAGPFSAPLNHLVFKRQGSLQCRYSFEAGAVPYSRVFLSLAHVQFGYSERACHSCLADPVDKIIIREVSANTTDIVCLCNSSTGGNVSSTASLTFLSSGPNVDLHLHYDAEYLEYNYFHNKIQVFHGTYEFFHGPTCGIPVLTVRSQGQLVYPIESDDEGDDDSQWASSSPIHCIWTIGITPHKDVFLWFSYLHLGPNCFTDRLEIRLPAAGKVYADNAALVVCGEDRTVELPIINSTNMAANKLLVELRASPSFESRFKLVWTEVMQKEHQTEYFLKLGMDACPFLCPGSNVCIPHDLVCNGVRNCPRPPHGSEADSALDEASSLCGRTRIPLNWLALGLGGGGGFLFTLGLLCVARKCSRRPRAPSTPELS